jgi:predicted RNA-binding protein YlqC (UPF0109 family)
LFVCGAVCLFAAEKGSEIAFAVAAALIAGATALAMQLSERQRQAFALPLEQLDTARTLVQQGRTSRAVRHLKAAAETDTRNAYRYLRRLDEHGKFRSSYTSHSRA